MFNWLCLRRIVLALILGTGFLATASAQHAAAQLDSGQILQRIQKLEVLGSVLYIAAHPDDENTRLISYLSNGRKVRTGYLSLTRGDGGQNLIGAEIGDALGIIRTQELLEARRIDGGEQFFTRAVDFGYSKSPEESFAKWGREEIQSDVVRAIRTFRPDVIITRFTTDGSGGHGHHTASAILANEAFDLAADPKAFPEQLAQGLEIWQAKRLFFNGSTWWREDLPKVAESDPEHWLRLDVGGFEPLLGASYNEIAGRSRSMHKSQGFGSAESRGEMIEYLRLEKGPKLSAQDLFDGIETTWRRVAGGEGVGTALRALVAGYDPKTPEASFASLCDVAGKLGALAASAAGERAWPQYHLRAVDSLLLSSCGAVFEATAGSYQVAAGDKLSVTISALQRRAGQKLRLRQIRGPQGALLTLDEELGLNRATSKVLEVALANETPADQPHWLAEPHGNLHRTEKRSGEINAPSVPGQLRCTLVLELSTGRRIEVDVPIVFKWVDPVAGERTRPVVVTPIASVVAKDDVALVGKEPATIAFEIESLCAGEQSDLGVEIAPLPEGWKIVGDVSIQGGTLHRGDRRSVNLQVAHGANTHVGVLKLDFKSSRGSANRSIHVIDHEHLLPQTWYTPAEVRLVPLDVQVSSHSVGYIRGAGDEIPRALERLGVSVETIDPQTADPRQLAKFDAIVTGVRAYNTVDSLANFQPALLEFVKSGGTLVVQYNTASASLVVAAEKIGPFPFQLTRNRVTVEEAVASFADPKHALLTAPNPISAADFEGWVQERGLYFAGNFGENFSAPITWNDPGEAAQNGALICCDFGKGRFIYTGISFFRELPAGVPGAYRLFANLISRRAPRE